MPFAADTFGALRSDARSFIRSLIHRKAGAYASQGPYEVGQAVWRVVSGAAVKMAVFSWSRFKCGLPLNMPLGLRVGKTFKTGR